MKSFFSLLMFFWVPAIAFSQTGTIEGTVYNSVTKEPLVGVEILILEIDARQKTDETGKFVFSAIPAGNYILITTIPDLELQQRTAIVVVAGETLKPDIYMETAQYRLEEVEVIDERDPKTVSKKSLQAEEITRLPGTGGDVLRALPAIPGIGVANDFSGALYIRGGSDEDNLYYFDRVPVGYPYHFGGLVSSLSSEIIDRIDVYAGGYGAEYGVDSQAVIDIYSQDSSPADLRGKFNLNLLYSEGLFQGKIGEDGFWYAAGRRSYIDLFIGSLAFETGSITAFPRFWDYQLKAGYDLNEKHQFFFNLFASGDRFSLKLDGENVDEDFRGNSSFESGFEGGGIHLRSFLTERLTSYLSLTRSKFLFDVNFGPAFELEIDAPSYVLREDLTYELNPKHRLESGLILGLEPGQVNGTFARIPDEGEVEYDIRLEEKVAVDEYVRGQRIEGYLQDRYALLPFLSVVFGLRFDYFNRTDELSIQPRGSLLVELPNSSELQFAYGIYNQTPLPALLSSNVGNPALKSSRASHYILELKRPLSQDTEIKMAAYYKDLTGLVTADEEATYLNQGVGYAQGTEIFLRHQSGNKLFGWISYAYALSKRRDRAGEPYRFYSFDQTHVATLAASYNLTPTWEIGAKWQYRTGNPYTPVEDATQIKDPRNGKPIYSPVYAETNSGRLPPYHRLDLRVSKTFQFGGWRLGFFLELLNAYNRKNLLDFRYSYSIDDTALENGDQFPIADQLPIIVEREDVNQLPILPYLGITAEF
ncbi:MAG: TonB-dependent receptor plug domain-containing protein [Candidatus Poribacteria bacterium]|nr:TonB-dependent receptor plug domain-containing protein [Candidatus Poribacteria bacterium]